MNRKSFIDTIDDETLAEMIDTTLNYEKRQKNERGKYMKSNLARIVMAVAAIVLVIGLASFMSLVNIDELFNFNEINAGAEISSELPEITTVAAIVPEITTPIVEIAQEQEKADPYAHVRFGATRNILLLEVEWHTVETYSEFVDAEKSKINEYKATEEYMQLSDEIKQKYDTNTEQMIQFYEDLLNGIAEGKRLPAKRINGFEVERSIEICSDDIITEETLAEFFDEDGYYIYNIYPYMLLMGYSDENGDVQIARFGDEDGFVYSKSEFDYVVENEVIPFLDDLLNRGLIMQEFYDEFIRNPLDKAVEEYFGTAADAQ